MRKLPSAYMRKQKKLESRLIRIMVGLLFMFLAFAAGFAARGDTALLERLGFDTGANAEDANPGMTVSGSTYESLSARVAEVQGILEKHSVNSFDLEATTSQMLSVITESTNDPFVSYLDEEHYEAYLSASSDAHRGIGVLFGENQGRAYAADVFAGSQAEAEGVRPGDYVVSISGDKGSDGRWTQAEVVKAVETAADQTLYITWRRPVSQDASSGEQYSTELKVADCKEPNLQVELTDDGVGYIKISQFTANSAELAANAVTKLEEQGAKSYVLDIRDNPGGYLSQAVDVGSMFLGNGTFVQIVTNESTVSRDASGLTLTDDPLVLIVNSKTGAAAEVLACGLKDNGRCTLIGENTQGRGTVQSVTALSYGGGIRYTSAYYKSPKGYAIEGAGVAPDAQVSFGDSGEDQQKEYAMNMAASLIDRQE